MKKFVRKFSKKTVNQEENVGPIKEKKTWTKNEKKIEKTGDTLLDSISFNTVYEDGICEISSNQYSISVLLKDINYQLSGEDTQIEVFSKYCDFLNSLGSRTQVQLTIQKVKRDLKEVEEMIFYEKNGDQLDLFRDEMNRTIQDKIAEERNGFKKSIIFTFIQYSASLEEARNNLSSLVEQFEMSVTKMGSSLEVMDGQTRLQVFANMLTKKEVEEAKFGTPQVKESFLPTEFDFKKHSKYIGIDEKVAQSLFVSSYPAELSDTFLSEILEVPKEMTVTVIIKPMDQDKAFEIVRTKLAFMEQQKVDEQKKALKNGYDFDMLPYDLQFSLSEGKELLEDLQHNGQKLFDLSMSTFYVAEDVEELEKIRTEIEVVGRRFGFKMTGLDYMQEISMNMVLPSGFVDTPVKRTLTTAGTAVLMPFTIPELIQPNGKYYGINTVTKNIISIDRKQLKAPNGFVLGTPGSGKSFSVKREIVNVLLRDSEDEVIIIDPEREYSLLAENFDGEIVKISSDSNTHINPLDINDNYGDEIDPVLLKSEFIISLFELIIGGSTGLDISYKTILDRVCRHVYEIFQQEGYKESPTLIDFYNVLKEQPEEEAQQLVTDLELYIEGSLSVFSHPTNVNIDKRLVVYDIKDLGNQLKTMGMLIVLDQVWNRITANRNRGVRTWLYIDELQLLFTNDYTANYFFELWSRARKWGAIPTGITQNVETLLLSDLARRMLSNSDFVMMLNQAKSDRTQLVHLFDISEEQEKFMTNTQEGAGVMIFGETILPFYDQFPKDTQLYRMMSTKPGEE